MRCGILIVGSLVLGLLSGCASYTAPGRGAPMEAFGVDGKQLSDSSDIAHKLELKPLASFPASIAVVRVQESGYRSMTCESTYGHGRYTVVTSHDVEPADTFERLGKLPLVAGVAPINRLLLHEQLDSDRDLREAAAALHAQMTLIYTIDTVFKTRDYAPPLSVVTLGLSPNESAHASSTVSAVLMDTQTGYIYAVADGTAATDHLANAWTNEAAADEARRRTESKAFTMMVDELGVAWKGVVDQYAVKPK